MVGVRIEMGGWNTIKRDKFALKEPNTFDSTIIKMIMTQINKL